MRWLIVFIVLLSGCDQMAQQPRADAQESSLFFPDGKVNQAPPLGTVARGELSWEAVLAERPQLTEELLARARGRRSDRMRTSALIPEGSER